MIRVLLSLTLALALPLPASAHFVFIVPLPGGDKATVILSETLEPDEDVDVSLIKSTALKLRSPDGDTPGENLELAPSGHAFVANLPGTGQRVVYGGLTFGVQQRGQGKPFLLTYHPKTIVGDPFHRSASLGDAAPAEILPIAESAGVRFQVLSSGKPTGGAKVTVIVPGGKEQELTAGDDGRTPPFREPGRYGVWARCVESIPGSHGGKPYEEIRRYPTLVVDVPNNRAAAAGAFKLPEATSSFGAASADGWLYVYGGHIAPTHHYDTQAVSGRFHRLKLGGAAANWEALPEGPGLQGMNLVAHGGKVYRVGGMQPRNNPGDEVDNHSVADVVRFDPAAGQWQPMPSLPAPRSSHDVVALGDKLIVVGGWTMKGEAGNDWPDTALTLDLTNPAASWTPIPQPFRRRAMIAAVHQEKVFVIGGFDEHDKPSLRVDVYDPGTNAWSAGPDLPGPKRNGFAPAACTLDGRLYASVADGTLYRLNETGGKWEPLAKTTPRIVHRLIPHGGQILVLGGAAKGDNLDLIESVRPDAVPRASNR